MIFESEGEFSVFDFDVEDPLQSQPKIPKSRPKDPKKKGRIRGPSKTFGLGQQSHRKPCASKLLRIRRLWLDLLAKMN